MAESFLLYGPSGVSKTSQCAEFHSYEKNRQRLTNHWASDIPGMHVTADSSFEPLIDCIEQGIVRPWNVAYEPSPLTALISVSKGMVPKDVDLKTGARLSAEFVPAAGALTIEGLYVFALALKAHLMSSGMKNTMHTEADGSQFGTAHLSIYDIIANNLQSSVQRMRGLQYVDRFLWTSHETKGTDAMSASVLGPAMLVNKGIDKISGWFSNTFHMTPFTYQSGNGSQESGRLLYFEPHQDQTTQLFWPCKTSLTPTRLLRLRARCKEIGSQGNCMPCIISDNGSIIGGISEILKTIDSIPGASGGTSAA
jgi:hypothetical protein